MSRAIRFRAWDKQRAQWFPMKNAMCLVINPTSTDLVFMTAQGPYPLPDTGQPNGGINRFVLEQFTGLQDAKGIDIYEGDIVLQHGDRDIEGWHFAVGNIETFIPLTPVNCNGAKWTMGMALGASSRLRRWTGGNEPFYEVVGNIHEHSHLLSAPTP